MCVEIEVCELTAERHRLQEQLRAALEQQQRTSSSLQQRISSLQQERDTAKVNTHAHTRILLHLLYLNRLKILFFFPLLLDERVHPVYYPS